MNGLALALSLLEHAEVPPATRAAALRRQAEQHSHNAGQIAGTPTGATRELVAVVQAMKAEADAMLRAASEFDRLAAEQAAAKEPEPPSLAQVG